MGEGDSKTQDVGGDLQDVATLQLMWSLCARYEVVVVQEVEAWSRKL